MDVDVPAVTGKGVPDPEVGRVVFKQAIGREPTEEEADALMRRRLDHLSEEVRQVRRATRSRTGSWSCWRG